MRSYLGLLAILTFFFTATFAWAADSVPAGDMLSQALETIRSLGGLPWAGKIAAIVMLLVGSMKVDGMRKLVWDKLPLSVQPFLAPILGLLVGILNLHPITLAGVMAYVSAGAGAIILYELLDAVKVAEASNAAVSAVIGFIQGLLKRK